MSEDTTLGPSIALSDRVGRRNSLVTRLVMSSLTVGILTLVLVGIAAFTRARSTLREATLERLSTVALLNERQLAGWIQRQTEVVEFLAQLPEVRSAALELETTSGNADSVRHQVSELVHSHAPGFPDLRELFLMSAVGGEVIASTDSERVGDYRVTDLFFTEGRQRTVVQNVYPSPFDGRPTMTVSTPIMSNGRLAGVLAAHLELERVDRLLEQRAGLGETGEAYLVSAYNDFVSSDRFGREGQNRGAHSEGITAALTGLSGESAYLNYRGSEVLGAYRWVPERELAVIAELEATEAFAPLGTLFRTIVALSLLSAIVLGIGTLSMARRIAGPVLAISEAATSVAQGDFTASAPVLTNDEVGALARAFNEMTRQLQSVYQDLNRQAQRREAALAELASARDSAQRANRAKGEFLAMMSHEIRTPMNGVLGMTEVLLSGPLDPVQREHAETIRVSGHSLLTVIDDVLDFSKIEAGQLEIESLAFNIERTVRDVTGLLEPRASDKGLALEVDLAPDVPRRVMGDAGRLRQILLNLTGNAIKFTDEGSIRLSVALVDDASNDGQPDRLRFTVRDSGIGIPLDIQSRLFQPFRQADSSTTRRFGGTGLGLAISKRLAELMGGSIHLASEPGKGSQFWIDLPATRVDEAEQDAPQSDQNHDLPAVGEGLSVLIVEDNPINQRVAEALLRRLGCTVATADNGRIGLEAIANGQFDLVFMDCRMPEMDGYEATKVIRSQEQTTGAHLPIVAMTANVMRGDREACFEAGMDDYVAKPIELSEIQRVLTQWGERGAVRAASRRPVGV